MIHLFKVVVVVVHLNIKNRANRRMMLVCLWPYHFVVVVVTVHRTLLCFFFWKWKHNHLPISTINFHLRFVGHIGGFQFNFFPKYLLLLFCFRFIIFLLLFILFFFAGNPLRYRFFIEQYGSNPAFKLVHSIIVDNYATTIMFGDDEDTHTKTQRHSPCQSKTYL